MNSKPKIQKQKEEDPPTSSTARDRGPISCVDIVPPTSASARGSLYVRLMERCILDSWHASVVHQVRTYRHRTTPDNLKNRVKAVLDGINFEESKTPYLDVWYATYSASSLHEVINRIESLR